MEEDGTASTAPAGPLSLLCSTVGHLHAPFLLPLPSESFAKEIHKQIYTEDSQTTAKSEANILHGSVRLASLGQCSRLKQSLKYPNV